MSTFLNNIPSCYHCSLQGISFYGQSIIGPGAYTCRKSYHVIKRGKGVLVVHGPRHGMVGPVAFEQGVNVFRRGFLQMEFDLIHLALDYASPPSVMVQPNSFIMCSLADAAALLYCESPPWKDTPCCRSSCDQPMSKAS